MANHDARNAARLLAVQALYQMDLTKRGVKAIVREFLEHRIEDDRAVESDWFEATVKTVVDSQLRVNAVISANLRKDWKLERLSSVTRAILRCGTAELITRPDVPAYAIVGAYTDLSAGFDDDSEVGFVNATLEAIAKTVRPVSSAPSTGSAG